MSLILSSSVGSEMKTSPPKPKKICKEKLKRFFLKIYIIYSFTTFVASCKLDFSGILLSDEELLKNWEDGKIVTKPEIFWLYKIF